MGTVGYWGEDTFWLYGSEDGYPRGVTDLKMVEEVRVQFMSSQAEIVSRMMIINIVVLEVIGFLVINPILSLPIASHIQ